MKEIIVEKELAILFSPNFDTFELETCAELNTFVSSYLSSSNIDWSVR